jgi:hypothetical protein
MPKKTIFSGILVSFNCRAGPTVADSLGSTLGVQRSMFAFLWEAEENVEHSTSNFEHRTEETPASIFGDPDWGRRTGG